MNFLCVVPVYNEDEKIQQLCSEIKEFQSNNKNIDFLLINNGSTDKSREIMESFNLKIVNNEKNLGVGFALIQGYKYAIKSKYDYLIHLAGNGKMKPKEINKFISLIENDNYDFVHGSRFLDDGNYKNNPLSRIILIRILTIFISLLFRKKITDATCGFRAFKTTLFIDILNKIDNEKYYTYRYEYLTLGKALLDKKINFAEVGVTMDYKKKRYSKIRPIIDWFPIIIGWLEAFFDNKKY